MQHERAGPSGTRSFVAVLLPDGIRRRIHEATAGLRSRTHDVAWVPVENLHLTLRFLGSVRPGPLERVAGNLQRAVAERDPFPITLADLGAFPRPAAARILWVGVREGAAAVTALQERIERAVGDAGFASETRAYHPHVTVGRVRERGRAPDVGREDRGPWESLGRHRVEAVHLMRSELGAGAARYHVLEEYRLRQPSM
jgi:2'-5' RNA ligase